MHAVETFPVTADEFDFPLDAIVMHPAPMNRGIGIRSAAADSPCSIIRQTVINGVAVRMAVPERVRRAMARS